MKTEIKEKNLKLEDLANEYRRVFQQVDDVYEDRIGQYWPKLKKFLDSVKGIEQKETGILNLIDYHGIRFVHVKAIIRSVLSPDTNLPTNISTEDERYTYLINIKGINALNVDTLTFNAMMRDLDAVSQMSVEEIQLAQKIGEYQAKITGLQDTLKEMLRTTADTVDV